MQTEDHTADKLIPLPRVQSRLGDISRSTLFALRREDETFPKAIPIGPRRVGFRERELNAWIEAQAAKVRA